MRSLAFLCALIMMPGQVGVGGPLLDRMPLAQGDNAIPTLGVYKPGAVRLAFLPAAAPGRNRSKEQPGTWEGVGRIVAVGDVHGDYDAFVACSAPRD